LTLVAILVVFLTGCSRNSDGGIHSGTGGWPPSSASAPAEVSTSAQVVKVGVSPVEIAQAGSADAMVTLSISPGYHVNANPATFPYLIATEITPGKSEGIIVGKLSYPTAAKQKFQFAEEPLAVYEGDAQIKLSLRADSKASAGSRSLPISVRVQACDNEKCYPPANLSATIAVEVK
jgi:hypothetical protein